MPSDRDFSAVKGEIYKAVENLGGTSRILGIIGSWRDGESDMETFERLEEWNYQQALERTGL